MFAKIFSMVIISFLLVGILFVSVTFSGPSEEAGIGAILGYMFLIFLSSIGFIVIIEWFWDIIFGKK
jgi:hypothetical protein